MHAYAQQTADRQGARAAFTLVELLVVISILVVLTVLTVAAVNVSYDVDRIRAGARQVQSYLEGARDRAIYAKEPRGVRFLLDPNDRDAPGNDGLGSGSRSCSSMVFVQPTEPWIGQVLILHNDPTDDTTPMNRVRLLDRSQLPNWQQLQSRDLLAAGARIKIPSNNRGSWYTVLSIDFASFPPNQDLILSTPYRSPNASGLNRERARIELPPSVMPNQEPVQLPRNIVIDFDRCGTNPAATSPANQLATKLPPFWKRPVAPAVDPRLFAYDSELDVMFSPRGTVIGPAASAGLIHFYLTEQIGADNDLDPAWTPSAPSDPQAPEKLLVTVFTKTGNISSHPVDTTDVFDNISGAAGSDGLADDPLKYAEAGEVAAR